MVSPGLGKRVGSLRIGKAPGGGGGKAGVLIFWRACLPWGDKEGGGRGGGSVASKKLFRKVPDEEK